MSTTEHDKDRALHHRATSVTGGGVDDGDDHQLPGIGYRRDKPATSPVRENGTPMRGQARFLLIGLGTLVPIAALTVPPFRRQLLRTLRADTAAARLDKLAEQRSNIAHDLATTISTLQPRTQYRLGPLPSLLLGALLGGGATLLYLARWKDQPQAQPQHTDDTVRAQPRTLSATPQTASTVPQAHVAELSGAVKEVAITMVGQAQELLSAARSAITAPTKQTDDGHAARPDAESPSVPTAEAQGTDSATVQAAPAPAPSAATLQIPTASTASLSTRGEQQAAEATTPQQISTPTPPTTPRAAKSDEKTVQAMPQTVVKEANAPAAPTAELTARIKEHMPVLDSKGMRVGAVDRVEATGSIKLAKDGQGKYHWLPLRWVTRVDTHVHLGRTAQQVRREWKTSAPRAR